MLACPKVTSKALPLSLSGQARLSTGTSQNRTQETAHLLYAAHYLHEIVASDRRAGSVGPRTHEGLAVEFFGARRQQRAANVHLPEHRLKGRDSTPAPSISSNGRTKELAQAAIAA